ncbi:hypothetical protein AYI69_g6187 [Smittium culicis]|uniref:Uncharacterized protein n=1 Tax=Smittium culicis TaxID=133412 RepID=A0A1R1Y0N0_9FUNG|nr:hypothetical protein AYI69_g6187 [Smittium culicis]
MISNSRALDLMISILNENDISVVEKKVVWLSTPQLLELYPGYSEEEKSSDGFNRYCAGPCIAINATGESSVFNATLCLSSAEFLRDVLTHIPTFNSSIELSPQDFYLFTSEPESSKHELSYIFQNSLVNLSSSPSISDCYFLSSNIEISTLILISEAENCLFENDFNSQILSNGFDILSTNSTKITASNAVILEKFVKNKIEYGSSNKFTGKYAIIYCISGFSSKSKLDTLINPIKFGFTSAHFPQSFNTLLVEKNKVDIIFCLPGEPASNSDILSTFEENEVKKENKKKKKKSSKKKKNNETLDKNDDSVHELIGI